MTQNLLTNKMNETISHLFHADLVYDGSVFYLHQPSIDSRVKGHRRNKKWCWKVRATRRREGEVKVSKYGVGGDCKSKNIGGVSKDFQSINYETLKMGGKCEFCKPKKKKFKTKLGVNCYFLKLR